MTNPGDDRIGSLIDHLVADARPVRRLRPPAVRLLVWLGVLLAVAALALGTGVRPDLRSRLAAWGYVCELMCLAAAAIAAAWVALRRAVPGLETGAGAALLGSTALVAGVLGIAETHLSLATPLATFVAGGLPCAVQSLVLALLPWVALLWAIRRGAPLRAPATCAIGGLAAALGAYLLMRLRCPVEETLHVGVWHGTPVLVATVAAALVGVVLARARRAGGAPL